MGNGRTPGPLERVGGFIKTVGEIGGQIGADVMPYNPGIGLSILGLASIVGYAGKGLVEMTRTKLRREDRRSYPLRLPPPPVVQADLPTETAGPVAPPVTVDEPGAAADPQELVMRRAA